MEKNDEKDIQMTAEHHVQVDEDGKNGKGVVKIEGAKEKSMEPKKSKRVAAQDAFRGLTIVIILVDDVGGMYERIDHLPWNGRTLADFIMPFFLFIISVAIALVLKVLKKDLHY